MAWVDCAVRDEHDAEHHTIAVVDVLALAAAEIDAPLVVLRGS